MKALGWASWHRPVEVVVFFALLCVYLFALVSAFPVHFFSYARLLIPCSVREKVSAMFGNGHRLIVSAEESCKRDAAPQGCWPVIADFEVVTDLACQKRRKGAQLSN